MKIIKMPFEVSNNRKVPEEKILDSLINEDARLKELLNAGSLFVSFGRAKNDWNSIKNEFAFVEPLK